MYINENLKRRNMILLWKAKKRAEENTYKFVWTRNGKIFVRLKEVSAAVHIEDEKVRNNPWRRGTRGTKYKHQSPNTAK